MKSNRKFVGFCIVASVLLVACSNQITATPYIDSLPNATFTPVLTFTPSSTVTTVPTAIPSITASTKVISSEFCIGPITPWSCSCGDLANEYLQIKNASQVGLCSVAVPFDYDEVGGYKITLPDTWFCKIVGAASNNLRCFSMNNQEIFLQALISELPITQADKAVSVFQEGDGNWSDPIVASDERQITRELITISDKQVLKLLTQQKGTFIFRYFIKNESSLYVLSFEMKDPDNQESKKTSIILDEAVFSMQFIQ